MRLHHQCQHHATGDVCRTASAHDVQLHQCSLVNDRDLSTTILKRIQSWSNHSRASNRHLWLGSVCHVLQEILDHESFALKVSKYQNHNLPLNCQQNTMFLIPKLSPSAMVSERGREGQVFCASCIFIDPEDDPESPPPCRAAAVCCRPQSIAWDMPITDLLCATQQGDHLGRCETDVGPAV